MNYLSVCSGIEAATCAWHPLGWNPVAFSEIEKFPSQVLAHHYPTVPNLGDMTKFEEWPDATIDLLVGGTPCQSFSVAGLRKGLADPRGNLMLTYGAIARRYRPKWLVWENVPGVLSSNGGRDFGTFLGMLGQLGYGFAYRVLDAQYFGVAQRRRRVFVVGCLGDWRSAAAVLFERHSLQGNPAPSREAGKRIAPCLDVRAGRSGETTFHTSGGLVPELARCVTTGEAKRQDYETCTLITHSLRGEGFDASEDGTGRGTPLVPVVSGAICKDSFSGGAGGKPDGAAQGHFVPAIAFPGRMSATQCASAEEVSPSLCSVNPTAVAVSLRGREGGATAELGDEVGNCLRASGGGGDKAHVLAPVAHSVRLANTSSNGWGVQEEVTHTLDCTAGPAVQQSMQVRRLTPEECEALQGFPRSYTDIKPNGKSTADGPRYKALGNSMAVPCMSWIGRRIQLVDQIKEQNEAAA